MTGRRTLFMCCVSVVAAVLVELARGAVGDNLTLILLSAPGIVAGRHMLPELAPLVAARRPPPPAEGPPTA